MLISLGRSSAERAKSVAIGILAGLLLLSLWQTSVERADTQRESRDRQVVADVARRFAVALTTYDYAHHDVQALHLAAISTADVVEHVSAVYGDVVAAKASSVGDASGSTVVTLTSSQAEVLVRTSQVLSTGYSASSAKAGGLLDITMSRTNAGWEVIDYHWLLAPGGGP